MKTFRTAFQWIRPVWPRLGWRVCVGFAAHLGLVVLVGLVLGACGEDPPKKKPKPAPKKVAKKPAPAKAPAAKAEAAPADEASEIAYAYSPIGKRDPFRSLFEDRVIKDPEQRTELQTYEVDQLKLVAVVSRIATPYAMVEDPSGKGHTLTRGTLIGKNWGRIAEINPECVVIKEEYRDYTGRKVTNKVPMCLPKPKELKLD